MKKSTTLLWALTLCLSLMLVFACAKQTKTISTIDDKIQSQVEKELKATVEKHKALGGTVIIMDPNNGEIISLVNYPNNNTRNAATSNIYEPGSTFKAITVAIALKNKVTDTKEKFWDEKGLFIVENKPIREAKGFDYGWMTLEDIVAKSSNIGSAKLGLKIGYDKFIQGIEAFGFGKKTKIDLPIELPGLIRKKGSNVDLARMAFGQGVAVTPIQMVKAYSVIANGGYDITPHIYKKDTSKKGTSLISENISKDLVKMLSAVSTFSSDADPFAIAGKTGTAQKAEAGGYSKDKYVASFVGFFPVSKPKYTMLVLIDEPKDVYSAGVVTVPLFRSIATKLIKN